MTVADLWTEDAEAADADLLPARDVLSRIADRWTIKVMRALQDRGVLRYTELELEDEVPGVSRKMLTQTLRAIERDGIIHREVFPGLPPHVEYSLTVLGRSALGPIDVLCAWSQDHMPAVASARRRYDVSSAAAAAARPDAPATVHPVEGRTVAGASEPIRGGRPRPLPPRRPGRPPSAAPSR